VKSLRLSILAMSIGAIVGCGGEDSSGTDNKTEATVYQAEVADEHLQDALVWLDLNNNYQLDVGEPNSYTDSTGNALLDVAALDNVPQAYSLIASAIKNRTINKTTGEKVSKSYLMVAPAGIQRISPVSHLLYSKQEAEGLAFEQATATIAAIIGEVSEQELLNFLNKQENKKLQALSHSLASVMPEAETPFTHQQLVQSHAVLERAVDAFNHSAVKTLEADLGLVSGENPISAVADETVDPNASEPSNNKQTPEVGLQVPSILGSPSITEIDISNSNQPQESAPVNAIMPTLEVASETPIAENQLPNETLQISEVVTTGTDTQGTMQLPVSNPPALDQPLSTEQ